MEETAVTFTREDMDALAETMRKIDEIHTFAKQLAETLDAISKNPMALMGMLPR